MNESTEKDLTVVENGGSIKREFTEAEIAIIENCGKVGFSYKELSIILSLPEMELREEFERKEGTVYLAWMKGRLQTELELRQSILKEAKDGSSPMLNQILAILQRTDEEHDKLMY